MTKSELQFLFQRRYDRDAWSAFLHTCIGVDRLLATPKGIVVPAAESSRDMKGWLLGEFETPDNYKIGLFEFSVAGDQASRRRVGLRNMLVPWLKSGDLDAAIAVFHSTETTTWRVSFICDLKGAATAAKRFTFAFGDSSSQYRTAVTRFASLGGLRSAEAASFSAIREAFSVEALSKEFYKELFAWYQMAISEEAGVYFPNDPENNFDDRENINIKVIRLITRLLFVWFIRQKHLVPANLFTPGTLKAILKDFDPVSHTSGNYYNAILQNLFFATLNSPILDEETGEHLRRFASGREQQPGNLYRYAELFAVSQGEVLSLFERIPYMNGGLFECLDKPKSIYREEFTKNGNREMLYDGFSRNTAKDPKTGHFKRRAFIPNYLFFDTDESAPGLFPLLDRYNFTVEENSVNDAEVSLDPELLGRVFENLLASYNPETQVTARNATGSFYTPREIVDYMVKESLDAYMKPVKDKSSEEQLKHLLEIKVLDPACGSGAFPMGMLHAIVERAAALGGASSSATTSDLYAIKLRVIENCIFGVDIQPIAMMITKLRFFISLICEQGEPTSDKHCNYGVNTLPNLETKFVAANSLVAMKKPPQQMNLFDAVLIDDLKKQLHDVRHRYFGAKTRSEKRRLRQEDKKLRDELVSRFSSGNLFDAHDAEQIAVWNPYDQVAVSPFFDPEWMFDIKRGFDVVIGNPPYIQLQADHGKLGDFYKPCGYETFAKTGDIYCLFYERGWQLLNANGHLCYITSNKWMRAGYGEAMRKFFAEKTNPQLLIDFAGEKIFESATVDTNILLFEKGKNRGKTKCCIGTSDCRKDLSVFVKHAATPCAFTSSESWVILSPIEQSIKRKIESAGTPLKDWGIQINYGIKTGCNEAFIIDEAKRAEILSWCHDANERKRTEQIIRPILRGRDIKRYGYDWAGLYLIATHNGIPEKGIKRIDVKNYPSIKRHLDAHWEKIASRSDMGDTPYNLRSCAYMEDFNKPKIVWMDLSDVPTFAYDGNAQFANNTVYFLSGRENLLYLRGYLNSKIASYLFAQIGSTSGVGTTRWQAFTMERLLVPRATSDKQSQIVRFVDQILSERRENPYADTSLIEQAIDRLVYRLYGLTDEEAAVIEDKLYRETPK